jgi:small subunit ribosomal protein S33
LHCDKHLLRSSEATIRQHGLRRTQEPLAGPSKGMSHYSAKLRRFNITPIPSNSALSVCKDDKQYLTPSQLQSTIFGTTYNPNRLRLGNKILRQRLKGPQLASYYPRKSATVQDVLHEFKKFDLEGWDEKEEDRLESLQIAKMRGKGAPKKKRTAEESKKNKRKSKK